jgi:hypothetical protein
MPEIYIPTHPLIAEAARTLIPEHIESSPNLGWLPTLGEADISRLRRTEEDKVVLKIYMDYLRGRHEAMKHKIRGY